MSARGRDWGGASGLAGRGRPPRALRSRLIGDAVPGGALFGSGLFGRAALGGTALGGALFGSAARCARRGLVALLVWSVLGTVSVLVWPSAAADSPDIATGSESPEAGPVTRAGLIALGTSPLGAVSTTAHGGLTDLTGITDMAVWAPPDASADPADLTMSGLAAMSAPVRPRTSGWTLMSRVMAVATQLAEGMSGAVQSAGDRVGPQRPSASAGLTLAAVLVLAGVAAALLSSAGGADDRHRCRRRFVSVLERPG